MKTPLSRALGLGLLLLLGAAPVLRADETLRRAQQALRDQGFYYGSVDGTPGDETTQALRRYQIRNGLAVTGQLDDSTRQALNKSPGPAAGTSRNPAPPPASTPRPLAPTPRPDSRLEEDRRYAGPRSPSTGYPPVRPAPPTAPASRVPDQDADDDGQDDDDPAPRAPGRPDLRVDPAPRSPYGPPSVEPRSYGVPPSATLSDYFASTPYEFAPPPVQSDVLRRAQTAMLRAGFYGGQPDGIPGEMTRQALGEFQAASGLRRTGRLDVSTLSYLRLMPARQVADPRPRVYEPRQPRTIYEGRVVR